MKNDHQSPDKPTALLGLATDELRALMQQSGAPAYRGSQLTEWIYRRGAVTLAEMTNLPAELRNRLRTAGYEVGSPRLVTAQWSREETVKLLLELSDGTTVETVGLLYPDRISCCVSTQVGCSVACTFCATGDSGYIRNLTAGEIVGQVLAVRRALSAPEAPPDAGSRRLDHVTFMGMGEPLLNLPATVTALQLLNREMGIAARNLTVSTVGLVPGIHRLAEEDMQVTLAVSLHAPTDALRRRLIPTMARWSVTEIIDACRDFVARTGRRVTIEYCLLGGVNDSPEAARELARVLTGLNCHVNLIPYNPVGGLGFRAPSRPRLQAFREILESGGIGVTQRVPRGVGIDAACGQLRRRLAEDARGRP